MSKPTPALVTVRTARRLLCLGAVLASGVIGCSRDEVDPDANKPFTLPGASKVLDLLSKNDFENTVGALAEIKAGVTDSTLQEYQRLSRRVQESLSTNQAEGAMDAYRALGVMERGR